jgi:hypothetical protein
MKPHPNMKPHPYRILFGAGLAVLVGTVSAQGDGDPNYPGANNGAPPSAMTRPLANPASDASNGRLPATRDMDAPNAPGVKAARPTAKMSGQSSKQTSDEASAGMQGQKPGKQARHASKRSSRSHQVASRGETIYHQALRQCVKEQDPDQRDNCLDNAIEQFQRNG